MNLLPRMERIVELHRHRAAALAVALGAALLWLVGSDLIGRFSWLGLLATLVGGSILLSNSDSLAGLILLAAMLVQWLTSGMGADTWWSLPAALLLLIAHSAAALVAGGPDQAPIPRSVLALWLPRMVLVGLATLLVGVLTLLIEPTNEELLPYGVAGCLLALAIAVLVLIRLTGDPDDAEGSRSDRYRSMYDRVSPNGTLTAPPDDDRRS